MHSCASGFCIHFILILGNGTEGIDYLLLKEGDKYCSLHSVIIFNTFISMQGSEVFVYLFLIKCLTKLYMVIIYGEF